MSPRYWFALKGLTPLLMHLDDVENADMVSEWLLDPDNKQRKGEKKGDDRRPAWTWVGYIYHDGEHITFPSANLTANFKKSGARVQLDAKRTFKEIAVSGVLFDTEHLEFRNKGEKVAAGPFLNLRTSNQLDFKKHMALAEKHGFRLYMKRATIGTGKHVRVRPRFDEWSISGSFEVTDDRLTPEALRDIFAQAGRIGLGDWRPGAPKSPGTFGMFAVESLKPAK